MATRGADAKSLYRYSLTLSFLTLTVHPLPVPIREPHLHSAHRLTASKRDGGKRGWRQRVFSKTGASLPVRGVRRSPWPRLTGESFLICREAYPWVSLRQTDRETGLYSEQRFKIKFARTLLRSEKYIRHYLHRLHGMYYANFLVFRSVVYRMQ